MSFVPVRNEALEGTKGCVAVIGRDCEVVICGRWSIEGDGEVTSRVLITD